jgi:diguanylate cyclase (GGDEF)-like protein
VFGRLGGEEFAALLPETDLQAARELACRIIESCRAATMDTAAGPLTITCSIGIAQVCREDKRVEDILNRADAGLYEAKRQGRDRIGAVAAVASVFGSPS